MLTQLETPSAASPHELATRAISNTASPRSFPVRFALVLAAAGVVSVAQLDIDAFPDTTPVQVQVNTRAPALGPEECERQITYAVEQVLARLPRLTEMTSTSKFGLSQVTVQFEDGTDIYFARQAINERLATVEIPAGIERPKMGPISTELAEDSADASAGNHRRSRVRSDRTGRTRDRYGSQEPVRAGGCS